MWKLLSRVLTWVVNVPPLHYVFFHYAARVHYTASTTLHARCLDLQNGASGSLALTMMLQLLPRRSQKDVVRLVLRGKARSWRLTSVAAITRCSLERFCPVLMVTAMHFVPSAEYNFLFTTEGSTMFASTSARQGISPLYRQIKAQDRSVPSVSATAE